MKRWTTLILGFFVLFGISLTNSRARADDNRLSVHAAFGRGLNTIGPGNKVNHAILPQKIKVDQGGVVHFLVSGSHVVTVYNPGTAPEDIIVPPPPPPFTNAVINDPTNRFYLGILPPDPPGEPFGTPETINPSNARNRVESVSFAEPGTYLVICNVRNHFLNGMFAFVEVKKRDAKNEDR
jgi:plastocyanin